MDSEQTTGKKFYLTSLSKTRKALNKLINEYNEDEQSDTPRFRALVSALRVMVEIHKLEKDWEIEERIAALEESVYDARQTD